jgi:hypothetical protein
VFPSRQEVVIGNSSKRNANSEELGVSMMLPILFHHESESQKHFVELTKRI